MRIRYYNAKILTMKTLDVTVGELWTEDDRISYVGEGKPSDKPFDREIDICGNLLMPSFKNCHTHSAMIFLRSLADDLPLQDWLFNQVFPREARLNSRRIYWFTRAAILEYLTSGVTAAFDMYFYPDDYAAACIDSGFRSVMCGGVCGEDKAEDLEDRYVKFNRLHPLIGYRLGMHSEYLSPIELIRDVSELAKKYNAPVFMHNSETKKEVEECFGRYGVSPTALFDREGIFDYGGGGFHCVWFDERDFEIFRKRKLWAVTNPASNLKLASGVAPICRFLRENIGVSIGTDGAASNNCLDMFREMFLVTALQKLQTADASACPAEEVLKMATVNGAYTMGLNNCDTLETGKQADIIEIDLSQPNMQPQHNTVKNIVYSGSKSNVKMTVCAGRILFRNGEFFVGEQQEKIYENAEKEVRMLLSE